LTPSWWIERRQRCTTGNGYCGRHALNCRVCTVYELTLVTSEAGWQWLPAPKWKTIRNTLKHKYCYMH